MNWSFEWYQELLKPFWAPPAWLFGPVWTVLYIIIAVTFCAVFYKAISGRLPLKTALPFALNLVFNLAFMPIFALKNLWLSSADILLVLATLIWSLAIIRKHSPWIAYANIPYLLWVVFAAALQLTIAVLNIMIMRG